MLLVIRISQMVFGKFLQMSVMILMEYGDNEAQSLMNAQERKIALMPKGQKAC